MFLYDTTRRLRLRDPSRDPGCVLPELERRRHRVREHDHRFHAALPRHASMCDSSSPAGCTCTVSTAAVTRGRLLRALRIAPGTAISRTISFSVVTIRRTFSATTASAIAFTSSSVIPVMVTEPQMPAHHRTQAAHVASRTCSGLPMPLTSRHRSPCIAAARQLTAVGFHERSDRPRAVHHMSVKPLAHRRFAFPSHLLRDPHA